MCHKCSFKKPWQCSKWLHNIGSCSRILHLIFSIKSLNNPIPRHLKYFHAFVPDCKLNLGNLVPKSALHVIYRIYLISNYISCTVQEYFYFFITWNLVIIVILHVVHKSTKTIHIYPDLQTKYTCTSIWTVYINTFDIKRPLVRWSKNYTRNMQICR